MGGPVSRERPRRGAITAFSTEVSPHSGQAISPAVRCVSNPSPSRNPPPNSGPPPQRNVYRIIETTSGRYFTLAEMAFAILGDNDRKQDDLSRTPSPILFGGDRMCDEFRLGKSPVVLERGNHIAHFGNSRHVDASANDADSFAGVGEHLPPR